MQNHPLLSKCFNELEENSKLENVNYRDDHKYGFLSDHLKS